MRSKNVTIQIESEKRSKAQSAFCWPNERSAAIGGRVESALEFLSEIPRLISEEALVIGVALVHAFPSDVHRICSLGLSIARARGDRFGLHCHHGSQFADTSIDGQFSGAHPPVRYDPEGRSTAASYSRVEGRGYRACHRETRRRGHPVRHTFAKEYRHNSRCHICLALRSLGSGRSCRDAYRRTITTPASRTVLRSDLNMRSDLIADSKQRRDSI